MTICTKLMIYPPNKYYTTQEKFPREEKFFPSGMLEKYLPMYGYFPSDIAMDNSRNIFTRIHNGNVYV